MSEESVEKNEEWALKYRQAVEPHLGGEQVEAVGPFRRRSEGDPLETLELLDRIARLFDRDKVVKGQLGELPASFLLVVTREKVYAFSYRKKRSAAEVREKVAEFRRECVSIRKDIGAMSDIAVLELSEKDGRKCRLDLRGDALKAKKNPWAAEVVAALSE